MAEFIYIFTMHFLHGAGDATDAPLVLTFRNPPSPDQIIQALQHIGYQADRLRPEIMDLPRPGELDQVLQSAQRQAQASHKVLWPSIGKPTQDGRVYLAIQRCELRDGTCPAWGN